MARDPLTAWDSSRISQAEWVVATCLHFGASPATAYKVAGLFLDAIEAPSSPRRTNGARASDGVG